jgi:hypothetical protein
MPEKASTKKSSENPEKNNISINKARVNVVINDSKNSETHNFCSKFESEGGVRSISRYWGVVRLQDHGVKLIFS